MLWRKPSTVSTKPEMIHPRGPWKTKAAVELASLEWLAGFNHHRREEFLGYILPAEAEANYCRQLALQPIAELST